VQVHQVVQGNGGGLNDKTHDKYLESIACNYTCSRRLVWIGQWLLYQCFLT